MQTDLHNNHYSQLALFVGSLNRKSMDYIGTKTEICSETERQSLENAVEVPHSGEQLQLSVLFKAHE